MPLDEDAQSTIDHLIGTCKTMTQALQELELDEGLSDSLPFCATIDDAIFCCELCGWWSDFSEMSVRGDYICDECDPEIDQDD